MINRKAKHAQAQVITTVLIILLVLAAIVIVWQVVGNTIESGSEKVEEQTACIGVDVEVSCSDCPATNTTFIAKRSAQGGTFESSELKVLVDGELKTITTEYTVSKTNPLASPLDTATITLTTAAETSVEVGVVGGGSTCPGIGEFEL